LCVDLIGGRDKRNFGVHRSHHRRTREIGETIDSFVVTQRSEKKKRNGTHI